MLPVVPSVAAALPWMSFAYTVQDIGAFEGAVVGHSMVVVEATIGPALTTIVEPPSVALTETTLPAKVPRTVQTPAFNTGAEAVYTPVDW